MRRAKTGKAASCILFPDAPDAVALGMPVVWYRFCRNGIQKIPAAYRSIAGERLGKEPSERSHTVIMVFTYDRIVLNQTP
ncbi:hypothetical protein SCFA_120036 [anaerobic digester metagenome]|uniref:Uncharacterized protein n=1 Tax=anaerobic digester metagenome TaxID=1263854 RepID=A0A485LVS5_9ZZZZ